MMNPDLKRSFKHFKRHEELGYLKLNFVHKVFLSLVFFILLPSVLLNLFFKNNKKSKQIFVLEYSAGEPYTTIYQSLKQEKKFSFIHLDKLFIPVLPLIFIKDVGEAFKMQPMFMLKNLYFLGALSLKISKYYFMIKYYNISNLIVFQEYSFYMSCLTRILEHKRGHLYNIQHGIPGDTYCHFRFSKCFVWGEYYKNVYVDNKAEKTQFVISGSILHSNIKKQLKRKEEDVDILYVMQGASEEMKEVVNILESLSANKVVRYIQHPRHPVMMNTVLLECDDNILDAIGRSKVIISHYSTALLDACFLGKLALSYTKSEKNLFRYVSYLDADNIMHTKENLIKKIGEEYNSRTSILSERYISSELNPIQIIKKEILG